MHRQARLRVSFPKLTPVQMFACIISIVFLTEAPLLPTFDGAIAKLILIPVSIAAGIGFACNVLIFPKSASSETLDGIKVLISPLPAFLDACLLALERPRRHMVVGKLMEAKFKITMAHKALAPSMMFLPIDVSFNRWSPEGLTALGEPLRRLVTSFVALMETLQAREEHRERDMQAVKMLEATYDEAGSGPPSSQPGHHQMSRDAEFRMGLKHPHRDELVENSLHAMAVSSEPLIQACKETIIAVSEALVGSNSTSKGTLSQGEKQQRQRDVLNNLRQHRDAFVATTALNLREPNRLLFNEDGSLKLKDGSLPPVHGIMLALLFQDRLFNVADSLVILLSNVIRLESNRGGLRLWLPKRIMTLFRWVSEPDNPVDTPNLTRPAEEAHTTLNSVRAEPLPHGEQSQSNEVGKRPAQVQLASMRQPNSRNRGKRGQILLKVVRWLSNTSSIFALRLLVVTIALSVPAVIRSNSSFFYTQKGLWAVIMAQLALTPYTGDLVYGVLARTAGTIVGGVIGMVAWYIGAGSGPGNPYGMAAIMAVVILIFMWFRLFTPPSMMPVGIMLAATAFLVVADGWIDSHDPTPGNAGVGYSIFWRRVVLVLVGFAGTVIVNFIPRPPSANRHYRHLLAENLASARDRYAILASNWTDPPLDLRELAEREAMNSDEALLSITGPITLTAFEFSTSNFNAASLGQICHLSISLNHSITQLLLCAVDMPPQLRATIIPSTGAVNEHLVSELMAVLSLAQQTLKSSDPLPALLPTPLFRKAISFARQQVREVGDAQRLFSADSLNGDGLRKYIVFINALVQVLSVVDELILKLKGAVGETSDMVLLNTA